MGELCGGPSVYSPCVLWAVEMNGGCGHFLRGPFLFVLYQPGPRTPVCVIRGKTEQPGD